MMKHSRPAVPWLGEHEPFLHGQGGAQAGHRLQFLFVAGREQADSAQGPYFVISLRPDHDSCPSCVVVVGAVSAAVVSQFMVVLDLDAGQGEGAVEVCTFTGWCCVC
jgi:hypothetical protein